MKGVEHGLNRFQVAVGLIAVALGTAWAAGGGTAVRTVGRDAAVVVPVAAILLGVFLLLRAAVPRGMLAAPVALIAAGALWLAVWFSGGFGVSPSRIYQSIIILAGVVTAMVRFPRRISVATGVERYSSPFGRRPDEPVTEAAYKYIVRAMPLGAVHLKFGAGSFPKGARRITVDATVLFGHFKLCVPDDWEVVAGRVSLAYWIHPDGDLSRQWQNLPPKPQAGKPLVVVNLQGLGGRVSLGRG